VFYQNIFLFKYILKFLFCIFSSYNLW